LLNPMTTPGSLFERSCLAALRPARFTPFPEQPITRASRAPQTWVECGPTPAAWRRESAEPVYEPSAWEIRTVEVPAGQTPVVRGTERDAIHVRVKGQDSLAVER
jgi:hypothetical protein